MAHPNLGYRAVLFNTFHSFRRREQEKSVNKEGKFFDVQIRLVRKAVGENKENVSYVARVEEAYS